MGLFVVDPETMRDEEDEDGFVCLWWTLKL